MADAQPPKTQAQPSKAFQGLGDLVRLLPTGTVFIFQFLNPFITNNGVCKTSDKVLSVVLTALLGFLCAFTCFTDSYAVGDKVYQGIVTFTGLASFGDPNPELRDFSKYRIKANDFVHAFFSLLVFGILSLLDPNTVSCLYPSFKGGQKLLLVLPVFVGGASSIAFLLFPTKRHGVGYPPSKVVAQTTPVSQTQTA